MVDFMFTICSYEAGMNIEARIQRVQIRPAEDNSGRGKSERLLHGTLGANRKEFSVLIR